MKQRSRLFISFVSGFAVCLLLNHPSTQIYRSSTVVFGSGSLQVARNEIGKIPVAHVKPSHQRSNSSTRIFCWVSTDPKLHDTRAKAVKETWIKRCDGYLFGSTKEDTSLPAVDLGTKEGYYNLWAKTRNAFAIVAKNNLDKFDWFLKVDDDSYVIVENLRALLRSLDPTQRVWLGCHYKSHAGPLDHMSGGPGYVLSRAALRAFVDEALPDEKKCPPARERAHEDVEMGRCLSAVGVKPLDSRDSQGRHRFIVSQLERHLADVMDPSFRWLAPRMKHPLAQKEECCSSTAVSFHYVKPPQMRVLEYLVYRFALSDKDQSTS